MASNSFNKLSSAYIQAVQGGLVPVFQYINPEIVLVRMLNNFLDLTNLPSLYPKFPTINVGAVHPFALLLFATENGKDIPTGLFPSVTVSDSSDQESYELLSHGEEAGMLDGDGVAALAEGVLEGSVLLAPANLAVLQAATANGGQIACKRFRYNATHTIDFSIWVAENKALLSQLYPLIKAFLVTELDEIRKTGIGITGGISGRPSGDVNVEFGRLLYGASISLQAVIQISMMLCYVPSGTLSTNIVVQPTSVGGGEEFHVVGEI